MKDAYTKTPEQVLSDLHSDGSGGLTKESGRAVSQKVWFQHLYPGEP